MEVMSLKVAAHSHSPNRHDCNLLHRTVHLVFIVLRDCQSAFQQCELLLSWSVE
jgi:hypothetical protein